MGSYRWKAKGSRIASCWLSNWLLLSLPHSVTGGSQKDIASVATRLYELAYVAYGISYRGVWIPRLNCWDTIRQMANYIKTQGKWRLLNCTKDDAPNPAAQSSACVRIMTIED
ncbi:hypothetical protein V8F44DRAFT_133818 [Aspergillus fumigatus]